MVMAPLAGYLIERVHAGLLGALGLFIMTAGLFFPVLLPASPADINIIWPMILCGAGFGLFQSPNNHTIITSAPRERSGGASGMLGTARLLGQSSGAALVALMLNQFGDNGTHVSLIAAAILAVIAACVSGLRITQPRSRGIKKARRSGRAFSIYFILLQVFTRTQSFNTFIQRRVSHEQLTERFRLPVNAESHHAGCFLRFIAGFQALQCSNHFLATNQFC